MRHMLIILLFSASVGVAHNSYTGGYSGAPGRQRCASSCHGGTAGTIVVSGFPSSYQPGQTYTITVTHNGGSRIVNFNATTRIGATTTVAGTFSTVMNAALYTGADGGVYANPHAIDTAVFRWTAPASGTGTVNFYCAGFQGTTSSPNGQSTFISLSAAEVTTGVEGAETTPKLFQLYQNFPNPVSVHGGTGFDLNSMTTIRFTLAASDHATLRVYDAAGRMIAVLLNEPLRAGEYAVKFRAGDLASGVYFYRLTSGTQHQTKRMLVIR